MSKSFPLKTCLRYPGGKSKSLKTLQTFIPKDFKEFRDPFLGGGSVPLFISQLNPEMPIWVNDKYYYLYNFWTQLRDNGETLTDMLLYIKTKYLDNDEEHKRIFESYQNNISTADKINQAVMFFVMNKCSYSGLTENSTFSVQASRSNFSLVGIKKLPLYSKLIKNWKITNLDYSDVINDPGDDIFIFLDPPYDIKSFLYGTERKMHSSFSHEEFANCVDLCKHKFMITYNKNEWITNRYKQYYQREWDIRYSMVHRGEKGSTDNIKKELLISNYNTEI